MFTVPENKVILTSIADERKIIISDFTNSIHEDMDLVISFFRAMGFQDETIIEAFEVALWEMTPTPSVFDSD